MPRIWKLLFSNVFLNFIKSGFVSIDKRIDLFLEKLKKKLIKIQDTRFF